MIYISVLLLTYLHAHAINPQSDAPNNWWHKTPKHSSTVELKYTSNPDGLSDENNELYN